MKPRIQDMHPDLQVKYLAFCGKMAEKGIPFGLSCVIRSRAEQDSFYAQGREPLSDVNAKRMTAGMSVITQDQNKIVTHTKESRHFPDENGKSRAFDILILRGDKTATWELKFDGNADGVPDYLEAAQIGRACGLECGAFWHGFQDYPHMQLPDKI
jgi:peptidoglycan L-alanyl-D-glutamate endopeptidase CwlK